jgi:hypothetical protein
MVDVYGNSICGKVLSLYHHFSLSEPSLCISADRWLTTLMFNHFQSNFFATRILPCSYLFWAGKRLVDYLSVLHEEKRRTGSDSGAGEQTQQQKKKRVGRLPTLERNRKIIMSDEVRRWIRKG